MGKTDNWIPFMGKIMMDLTRFQFFNNIGPKCNPRRGYFCLKCCNNNMISDHFKLKLSKFFFAALASLAMYDHTANVKNITIIFLFALLLRW